MRPAPIVFSDTRQPDTAVLVQSSGFRWGDDAWRGAFRSSNGIALRSGRREGFGLSVVRTGGFAHAYRMWAFQNRLKVGEIRHPQLCANLLEFLVEILHKLAEFELTILAIEHE